jgi:IclR family KDG regulon transcriptional repressor
VAETDVGVHRSPAPAVATAARLLDALAGQRGAATLDELTNTVGEPRSSVHRVLTTLVNERVVDRAEPRGGYRLGPRLADWGSAYLRTVDLFEEFQRVARRVVSDINETLQLAVLDWPDVVFVAKVDSTRQVRLVTEIGRRIPAYASAAGKVLLASRPELVDLYDELKPLTAHTLRSAGSLRDELEQVRQLGFAEESQETAEQLCCVAAPVTGSEGAVAAVSICVVCAELDSRYRHVLSEVVRQAAADLSALLDPGSDQRAALS